MGAKLKDNFEPDWDDEKDWLCAVEFLPPDDPEARSLSTEITWLPIWLRTSDKHTFDSLATLTQMHMNSCSLSPRQKKEQFLDLVRSNDDIGNDYIENDFMSPTTEEIMKARPLAMVLPEDVVTHATLVAASLCAGTELDRTASKAR